MKIVTTAFPGLLIIEPRVFDDSRGYFYESYNEKNFHQTGITTHFVQDNQALSSYGVIRGLHFQLPPHAQSKLIRAIQGTILDVVVDIRKGSPTYGQLFSIELSAENKKQFFIPKGFAHGYSVLSPTAEVMYKCDAFYSPASEGGIIYNDPALNIDWQIPEADRIISEKDKLYPILSESQNTFVFAQSE